MNELDCQPARSTTCNAANRIHMLARRLMELHNTPVHAWMQMVMNYVARSLRLLARASWVPNVNTI